MGDGQIYAIIGVFVFILRFKGGWGPIEVSKITKVVLPSHLTRIAILAINEITITSSRAVIRICTF